MNNKHEGIFAFLTILIIVGTSNYSSVFGLDILLGDDNARYLSFVNGTRDFSLARGFFELAAYFKLLGIYLFSAVSVESARAFFLLFYMIPVSYLFYYYNRNYLKLSLWISLGSAVIINILPEQYLIPAFLDGSYPVPGMITFLVTLILIHSYLNERDVNYYKLAFSIIAWFIANDMNAELSVFLFPVIAVLIITDQSSLKRKLSIFIPVLSISFIRVYSYFNSRNAINTPVEHSLDEIKHRIIQSIDWWLPYKASQLEAQVIYFTLFAIVILGILFLLKKDEARDKNLRALALYTTWFLSTGFPFWFLSKSFTVRYFYVSHIALTAIFFILTYQIIKHFIPRNKITIYIMLFFVLSFYGYQRNNYIQQKFDTKNKKNDFIISIIENENLGPNSQIALVNIDNGTGGKYIWSSGYFSYVLNDPNIRGIMGREYNFYNPFLEDNCLYVVDMSCLSSEKELIAFKVDMKTKHHKQMHYFLKWETTGDMKSDWIIYDNFKENNLNVFQAGSNLESYKNTLKEYGINSSSVLWGNLNDLSSFN